MTISIIIGFKTDTARHVEDGHQSTHAHTLYRAIGSNSCNSTDSPRARVHVSKETRIGAASFRNPQALRQDFAKTYIYPCTGIGKM